jgi:hypothetical protein
MQIPQEFHPVALEAAQFFVLVDESPEFFVFLPVLLPDRTLIVVHAFLLTLEMNVAIGFQIVHEFKGEADLLLIGVGGMQQLAQQVDVINQ